MLLATLRPRPARPRRRRHPRRWPDLRRLAGLPPAAAAVVLVALTTIAAVALVGPPAPAAAAAPPPAPPAVAAAPGPVVSYLPPVGAPVVDPFRPPAHPFGPGNRGIEYDTAPGDPVHASADGIVTFAGPVAGSLHVTIRHADGVRTAYSFLQRVDVAAGTEVRQGDVLGRAGDVFHLSARIGDAYVDPAALFDTGATVVELVPFEVPPGASPGDEAARVVDELFDGSGGVGGLGLPRVGSAYDWLRARAEGVARAWDDLSPPGRLGDLTLDVGRRLLFPPPCSDGPPPRAPAAGADRVAVTVAGLGSSGTAPGAAGTGGGGGGGAIGRLRTADLGYDEGRVVRFSYAGGVVPGSGAGLGLAERPYGPGDTAGDLREAGHHLADVVEQVLAADPDATVDLLAHSQGGLVARLALAELDRRGADVDRLGLVATLGTPHEGADLASAARLVGTRPTGALALEVAGAAGLGPGGLPLDSTSIAQMAEGSDLLAELDDARVPEGVDLVSIAARGDPVVAPTQSQVGGATNVTVPVTGWGAHTEVVGSDAATDELARALAGEPPACEGVGDVLGDALVGHGISYAEDAAGLALYALAR